MDKLQELNLNTRPLPEFIRGQTLHFVMYLPKNIHPYYFRDWIPTAQLRKLHNPTEEGFIADLEVDWYGLGNIALLFRYSGDTSKWPLGPVEFDVVFTHPTTGSKVRTLPVRFNIVPGVTQ